MCLLVLAWRVHPRYRLIVAANRDEYHDRPAAPLAQWEGPDKIFAGRDLRAGGTWFGVDQNRRFGVVTNFRELQRPKPTAPSRGRLVPDYLSQRESPGSFLRSMDAQASAYSGFNLLLADEHELHYATNREAPFSRSLEAGIFGLSNRSLDTPWPKLLRTRRRLATAIQQMSDHLSPDVLFEMLADRTQVLPDETLPDTGLDSVWERTLSSPFVLDPRYGTRCSTVLLIEHSGMLRIVERRFDSAGTVNGETELTLNAL